MTKRGRPRVWDVDEPSAKAMRAFRDKHDFNTAEAAAVLGVPQRTIEGIEQGRGFRYPRLLELVLRRLDQKAARAELVAALSGDASRDAREIAKHASGAGANPHDIADDNQKDTDE